MPTPHDTFSRSLLQHVENAVAVLRWCLPPELSAQLDHPTSGDGLMPDDGLEEAIGGLQVRGGFLLVDLSTTDDEEIAAASLGTHARLGLLLLKHAPTLPADRIWRLFVTWARWLGEIVAMNGGHSRLVALLNYVGTVVGTPSRDELDIIAAELAEPAVEGVVTWAEALRQEGVERGLERGLERGMRRSLLAILRHRFEAVPDEVVARIEAAGAEQLEAWTARALDAHTVGDVFAG